MYVTATYNKMEVYNATSDVKNTGMKQIQTCKTSSGYGDTNLNRKCYR